MRGTSTPWLSSAEHLRLNPTSWPAGTPSPPANFHQCRRRIGSTDQRPTMFRGRALRCGTSPVWTSLSFRYRRISTSPVWRHDARIFFFNTVLNISATPHQGPAEYGFVTDQDEIRRAQVVSGWSVAAARVRLSANSNNASPSA